MEAITVSAKVSWRYCGSLSHQDHIFTDFIGDIQPVSLSLYNYTLSPWQISKEDLWESLKLHFHWREWKQSAEWNPGLCFTTLSHLLISPKLWRDLMDVHQQAMKTKILTDSSSKLLALKNNISLVFISDDPWAISVMHHHDRRDMALIDRLKRKDMFGVLGTWVLEHKRTTGCGLGQSPYLCLSFYTARKCIIFWVLEQDNKFW